MYENSDIVKEGVFLYDGTVPCDIRIFKHHKRYGTGDPFESREFVMTPRGSSTTSSSVPPSSAGNSSPGPGLCHPSKRLSKKWRGLRTEQLLGRSELIVSRGLSRGAAI
jgi:hypothetical protein